MKNETRALIGGDATLEYSFEIPESCNGEVILEREVVKKEGRAESSRWAELQLCSFASQREVA